jgi:hypothetical protein
MAICKLIECAFRNFPNWLAPEKRCAFKEAARRPVFEH